MLNIDWQLECQQLQPLIDRLWQIAARKALRISETFGPGKGTPVFTKQGKYVVQDWTEWTKGFQFGILLLVGEATGDTKLLELGQARTVDEMPGHVTHSGVHDHGFNIVSTYGNLWRMTREGRWKGDLPLLELALRVSGTVQASRWSLSAETGGYIYSFNGPHSLFCDTIRSLRSLALAHRLGHVLLGEQDESISLLGRLLSHAHSTAVYSVYYGEGRDYYDVRGRVAHESLFNPKNGQYRCPSTQQGYSPFTTWTRGLGWILLGFPEILEFLETLPLDELDEWGGMNWARDMMLQAASACADFYIEQTPTDGVPYWDTGAPGLGKLDDYQNRPADPFNNCEPVDSSAAAIACQGFLRLGNYLQTVMGEDEGARKYWQAGLTILRRLLDFPYLSKDPDHQGLLLHAVYHRPRQWDYIRPGSQVPHSESALWGDYHLVEAALLVHRLNHRQGYLTFFGPDEAISWHPPDTAGKSR